MNNIGITAINKANTIIEKIIKIIPTRIDASIIYPLKIIKRKSYTCSDTNIGLFLVSPKPTPRVLRTWSYIIIPHFYSIFVGHYLIFVDCYKLIIKHKVIQITLYSLNNFIPVILTFITIENLVETSEIV